MKPLTQQDRVRTEPKASKDFKLTIRTQQNNTKTMRKKFTSDYVCFDCGKKYGQVMDHGAVTFHQDDCGVCGKNTGVTDQRHYGRFLDKGGWKYVQD